MLVPLVRVGCSADLGTAEQLLDMTPFKLARLLGAVGEPTPAEPAPRRRNGMRAPTQNVAPGATANDKLAFIAGAFS